MSILPNNNLIELAKVPIFISHWQQEHSDLNFLEFLDLHYSDTKHHEEEHERLPFHSYQNVLTTYLLLETISFSFFNIFSLKDDLPVTYQERLYSFLLNDIWQPPRF